MTQEEELLFLTFEAEAVRLEERKRRRETVSRGGFRLQNEVLMDVCRILLAADPSVDPLLLRNEDALCCLISVKFGDVPWRDGSSLAFHRPAADDVLFRAEATALLNMIREWIEAAQESARGQNDGEERKRSTHDPGSVARSLP